MSCALLAVFGILGLSVTRLAQQFKAKRAAHLVPVSTVSSDTQSHPGRFIVVSQLHVTRYALSIKRERDTSSMMEPINDGGVVLSLFLMVAAIGYALFSCITIYDRCTSAATASEGSTLRLLKLLSGSANFGNSFIHIVLIIYMKANETNLSDYWLEERKLGGIEGPVGLAILNFGAAISALFYNKMTFPLCWNAFVACAGTFIPIVWLRFIKEGLACWPYEVIFIWFWIFAMELTAVSCSVTHFAIERSGDKEKAR